LPLSGAGVTGFFILLNQWKKVSIHSAGVGIFVGFILAYISVNMKFGVEMLIVTILLSGVVMAARSYLQKHTMQELLVGWLTGFIITFSINYFY
jgi:membrane-associated phospholipid phosphatase